MRNYTFLIWALAGLIALVLTGCAGNGFGGGNSGGAGSPTYSGFYTGTVTPTAGPRSRAAAGTSYSLAVNFNNNGGTAIWKQSSPPISFSAGITNVHYNAGTKELSFQMSAFTGVFKSAN